MPFSFLFRQIFLSFFLLIPSYFFWMTEIVLQIFFNTFIVTASCPTRTYPFTAQTANTEFFLYLIRVFINRLGRAFLDTCLTALTFRFIKVMNHRLHGLWFWLWISRNHEGFFQSIFQSLFHCNCKPAEDFLIFCIWAVCPQFFGINVWNNRCDCADAVKSSRL